MFQAQNQNIELYVNANFEFFDPYNLLDFLNDFLLDRNAVNQNNCDASIRPLQVKQKNLSLQPKTKLLGHLA